MDNKKRRKNQLLNILINIAIPIIVLTKFSGDEFLGAKLGLIVALIFPLIYGIWGFHSEKRINFLSGLGVVSVLLTGIIGLFEFPNSWLAVKEAGVPFSVGAAFLISYWIGAPLLNGFLKEILDFKKIFEIAKEKNKEKEIKEGLKMSNYIIAAAFFAAAVANFVLAKLIVVSVPGTAAYNSELGTLTGLSFIVILVPFLVVFTLMLVFLLRDIKKKTGLELEDVLI